MTISRRSLLAGAAAGALGLGLDKADAALCYCQGWGVLPIGGGGFVDGISQSTDGVTTVCRNDSGHAYLRSVVQNKWIEITTTNSIPAPYNVAGALTCECVVAPSNNQIIYLLWNGRMFKSTNAGTSFNVLLNFNNGNALDPNTCGSNDNYRLSGYKIAVDPINPNVVLVGTGIDGLWMTTDGGNTWTLVTGVPVSVPAAFNGNAALSLATTAPGSGTTLTFSSNASIALNNFCFDATTPTAIAANTTVATKPGGGTQVTLTNSAAGVGSGDIIVFSTWYTIPATGNGSGNTVACAGGTTGVANGMYIFDLTNPKALLPQTTVSSSTSTSLTLNNSAASIVSGDFLLIVNPATVINNNPNYAIAFDPSSAQVGGSTQGIYAYGNGSQIYHSTNGGTTWSALSGGPSSYPQKLRINPAGLVWAISASFDGAGATTNVWSWNGAAFTQVSSAAFGTTTASTVAVSPFINAGHYPTIFFQSSTNPINLTMDDGATWTGVFNGGATPTYANNPTSNPVGWLATINNGTPVPSPGCAMYDNVTSTRLWMADGVGTHYCNPAPTSRATFTWFENTFGIENLVITDILGPPGARNTLVTVQDRQIFAMPTLGIAPTTYQPTTVGINACNGIDYASNNPLYLAGVIHGANVNPCWSNDGGNTWTIFATTPASFGFTNVGGSIACASYTSATVANVVMIGGNTAPFYTIDNGTGNNGGWQACSGLPAGGGFSNGTGFRILAADRVNIGTFYIFYPPAGGNQGFYRSTDNGATWTQVYNGQPSGSGGTTRLRSLPGVAGTILFNNSTVSGTGTLQLCTNALTATGLGSPLVWTNINAQLTNVVDFGFGAYAPGATYPTIFVIGTFNSVQGFWKSTNLGSSWTQIQPTGANPLSHVAQWSCVGTHMGYYDRMFVGTSNDGAYWFS